MNFLNGRTGAVLFLAAMVACFTLLLIYGDSGVWRLTELKAEKQRLVEENQDLAEKNRRLLVRINRLKSDPRCIEDEARKKLGLILPNETIYRLDEEMDEFDPQRPVR
jgi:cell division protein FtsB